MSTSETVTFTSNVCPCGIGTIEKHVTTQDNPWSGADISYELNCTACAKSWSRDIGSALVKMDSKIQYDKLRKKQDENWNALHALTAPLVDGYFKTFAAKSKKAEWTEMLRLDVYPGSYKNFLDAKNKGKSPSEIGYGIRNVQWITRLAKANGTDDALTELLSARDALDVDLDAAARQIVRWPFEKKT